MSWFRLLFEYRGSALSRIKERLLAVLTVACAVTYAAEELALQSDLTTTPFTLIGLALGVFLGFRNNVSYDRYWEGRRLWGRVVNDARSFTRLVLHNVEAPPGDEQPSTHARVSALQRELVHRMIGYAHALRMHLRGEIVDAAALAPWLPEHELSGLREQRNAPLFVSHCIGGALSGARRSGLLSERATLAIELVLTDLVDAQGGCERIRNTPIPWSYTVLIHTIVAVYCFALPFGLVATTHLLTPLVVLMIAYAFLGLDAVGDELEEPFGTDINDLPLSTLTRTIEVNLRQLLGERDLPPMLGPNRQRVSS